LQKIPTHWTKILKKDLPSKSNYRIDRALDHIFILALLPVFHLFPSAFQCLHVFQSHLLIYFSFKVNLLENSRTRYYLTEPKCVNRGSLGEPIRIWI